MAFLPSVAKACCLVALSALIAGACASSDESPYSQVEKWECFERLPAIAGAAGATSGGASGVGGGGAAGVPSAAGGGAGDEELGCDCYSLESGEHASDPKPQVPGCADWSCCFAWTKDDGSYACHCGQAPVCSVAAEQFGAEVVDACPPTPRDNPTYCAFFDESCESDYLAENGLSGCCEDLTCKPNAYGVMVCRD